MRTRSSSSCRTMAPSRPIRSAACATGCSSTCNTTLRRRTSAGAAASPRSVRAGRALRHRRCRGINSPRPKGLRVPLIIAWPGHAGIRAGAINDGLAHVTDILPTLTELADVSGHGGSWQGKAVESVTGRELVPMLQDGAGSVHGDAPLGYELSGNSALFRGDYKLVRNLAPTGDGKWRLYNLKTSNT